MKLLLRLDIPKTCTMDDLKYILDDMIQNMPEKLKPFTRVITDCDDDEITIGVLQITK